MKESYEKILKALSESNLINSNGRVSSWLNKKIDNELKDNILKITHFLSEEVNLTDRIKAIQLGITSRPTCKVCGLDVKYYASLKNFSETCSKECSSIYTKEKKLDTIETKTGKREFFQFSKEEKIEYSKKGANQAKESIQKKYGISNVMQLPEVKDKHKTSVIEYHKNTPKKTFITGEHQTQRHFTQNMIEVVENLDLAYENHINNQLPISKLSQVLGFSYSYLHRKMKNKYDLKIFTITEPHKKVLNYLNGLDHSINDRKVLYGKELDIFIPSKKVAIEIDGLFWHTNKKQNFHAEKTKMCEELGIRLLRFTDLEVNTKWNIVKSIIDNALKNHQTKIYARKCKVKVLHPDIYKQFMEANHIGGYAPAKYKIGLYYENTLVYCLGISKSRYDKKHNYELIRAASLVDNVIVGGLSKAISNAKRIFLLEGSMVTFADKRYFTGKSYISTNFTYLNTTPPNYWYWHEKTNKLESRIKYQKHKLKNLLEVFEQSLSEKENMKANGFRIYHDCGHAKYYTIL